VVEAELREMLNVQDLDPSTPEYFRNRTAAAKRVYEKMNAKGKEEVETLVESYKTNGNPLELRQK
jgi:hypothetical protein